MRLLPSDPDIRTVVSRIEGEDIDLEPDFQRGEVWPLAKRQKLIDSILRNWHVPPIHLIEERNGTLSVLDGKQRLAAIRDFVRGVFSVDGNIQPASKRISSLDGRTYSKLPAAIKKRFDTFPLRMFTVVDYKAAEPSELFYRLNQPASLTPAEQRNAFFGAARQQVRDLVERIQEAPAGIELFGFANTRMAYDDVLSRVLFLLDARSLRIKTTAAALAEKYRSGESFSLRSMRALTRGLRLVERAQSEASGSLRFNKATAQSWLVFLATAGIPREMDLALVDFIHEFELARRGERSKSTVPVLLDRKLAKSAMWAYENRATSRVADVSSVVTRDMVIWMFFLDFARRFPLSVEFSGPKRKLLAYLKSGGSGIPLDHLADEIGWGDRI